MGVSGLAFVAFLVTKAVVQKSLKRMEGSLDSIMVKAVLQRIVDSDLPFTALHSGHTVSHNYTFREKTTRNYKSREILKPLCEKAFEEKTTKLQKSGGNTDPRPLPRQSRGKNQGLTKGAYGMEPETTD